MQTNTLKKSFFNILASLVLVIKRAVFLAIHPYKTMRSISQEKDVLQILVIFMVVFIYFHFADLQRPFNYPPFILFVIVLINILATAMFFYFISKFLGSKQKDINPYLYSFSYALIPTIIWFSVNVLLYVILPPPRLPSFNGKLFTVVYITFSVSMLLWKFILTYLAIRFSTRLKLTRVLYSLILYLLVIAPYTVLLYQFRLFRVPFL
jgi:hypothetical protein